MIKEELLVREDVEDRIIKNKVNLFNIIFKNYKSFCTESQ